MDQQDKDALKGIAAVVLAVVFLVGFAIAIPQRLATTCTTTIPKTDMSRVEVE